MTLFQVTLYAVGAGPDQSVSIQFWASTIVQAEARVYAELNTDTVILDLKQHRHWARRSALSPGGIEAAYISAGVGTTKKIVNEGH